ncbi:hypothetical protein [Streptomyces sp. NBC_00078]|uniref:hypothetical protein n=1 Tax=Streptomyces sp. NBC_00078 TaxID=2975643 RepID=UPI002250A413|nr:hypothetical protein [Streptomyces sp. NBC_00078]MCX5426100.1 hypothetical protein [Streptomyces sp. NBC_00078]
MKLTAPQTAALRLIHDTPGRVAARVNGASGCWIGFRTLHHRTEARLVELSLVETAPDAITTKDGNEVPVLRLTAAGYEALGITAPAADETPAAPAAEDVLGLPISDGFRITYTDEIGDTHLDADSATYRLVWEHVTTNRPTAPRWLLGHLADVASLVADLVEDAQELASETRALRRQSCAELLGLLFHHGARPWPLTGHGTRPLDGVAHCEDCAPFIGYAAPADVIAAEAAEDKKRADEEAAYEVKLAAQLRAVEEEIAATYGEHMRAGQVVSYTNPDTGKAEPAVVQSVYYRAPGEAGADILLVTGQPAGVLAQELEPLPPLPDMGELIEGRWLITDKAGEELARVEGTTREEALAAARRIPAVRAAAARDGGLASRPLWTSDLARTS